MVDTPEKKLAYPGAQWGRTLKGRVSMCTTVIWQPIQDGFLRVPIVVTGTRGVVSGLRSLNISIPPANWEPRPRVGVLAILIS